MPYSVSETQIRIAAGDIFTALVRPHVLGVAAATSADAALARTVRAVGLTASNQCTSFSAHVLADPDCAGGSVGTMVLGSIEDSKHLVNQYADFGSADARLPRAGTG